MPFVEELRKGRDLVMGNRFLGGIKPGAMPWKNRYMGNPALTGLAACCFVVRERLPLRLAGLSVWTASGACRCRRQAWNSPRRW